MVHHLVCGLERVHVVDNGSRDGTTDVLRRLAGRLPLSYTVEPGLWEQEAITNHLVHDAARAGADWVLVFDADEFWLPGRPLPEWLGETREAALAVQMTHFVQRREQDRLSPRGLLTMTMRKENPLPLAEGLEAVRERRAGWVEVDHAPKLIVRASTEVELDRGSHGASGLASEAKPTSHLEILHAPLRARAQLRLRAEHGRRVRERGLPEEGDVSWHVLRWADLDASGELEREWEANSHANGHLDVYGERHPLVEDTRLREIVTPHVRTRAKQALARVLRRAR